MTVSCRCAFVATSVFKDREKLEDHVSGEQEPLSMKRNMLWNSAGSFTNLLAQWLITVLVVRIASGYDAAGALFPGCLGVWNLRPCGAVPDVHVPDIRYPSREHRRRVLHAEGHHERNRVGGLLRIRVAHVSPVGCARDYALRSVQICGTAHRCLPRLRPAALPDGLHRHIFGNAGRDVSGDLRSCVFPDAESGSNTRAY